MIEFKGIKITDRVLITSVLLLLINTIGFIHCFKPVVIVHGIFDHKDSLFPLMDRIAQKHKGTNVTIIDKLHGWRSMSPLWLQVKLFRRLIRPIMEENPQGIHLIGYSQGGLVARALTQSMQDHNIHTFISLSAPQGGQYGDEFLKHLFPGYIKETAWKVFYRKSGQIISVGNYWRDPHHLDAYYNQSQFLPFIDNQVSSVDSTHYRNNFMRLRKVVLIGGPDDEVISPWQSSHFGCYDTNEEILGMVHRDYYKQDLFGLRTLNEEGKVIRTTVPGVKHLMWHKNLTIIDNYIIPFLI